MPTVSGSDGAYMQTFGLRPDRPRFRWYCLACGETTTCPVVLGDEATCPKCDSMRLVRTDRMTATQRALREEGEK